MRKVAVQEGMDLESGNAGVSHAGWGACQIYEETRRD